MKYFEKHPMLLVVVGIVGCGLAGVFVKLSAAPSAMTAAVRLLWTVLLLSPVTLGSRSFRQELLSVSKKDALLSALSGLFLAVHFVIWFESLRYTSVAISTTICCTEVVWVTLGFCLILKGSISRKALLAIGVTLLGNVLIAWADLGTASGLLGDLMSLAAAVLLAAYTIIGRVVRMNVSTTVYTYICYSACALALVLTCLLQGLDFAGYGYSPYVAGLLLAIFSTILGHSIFNWCLKFFTPSFVSASKLCIPITSAVFAFLAFSEIPTVLQVIGCLVILGGMCWYYMIESGAKNEKNT